jgi:1-deoxy-D-xylulose 5-phosphate reductoisomerase
MKIEDYIEIINEKRPHIKPNSARTYAISLRSIAPKDATSMKWLSNVDYVLKQLQRYKETTRKNILNAVIVASNGVAAEKFVTERDRYNDLYAQHTKAHKKTASQQKNWVEWSAF